MKKIIIAILSILIFTNIAYAAKPKVGADQLKANSNLVDIDGTLKVYSKTETDSKLSDKANTSAVALKANSADVYTKAQAEATIAVMIKDNAQAKYWYAANMINGDVTGEIAIMSMATSCNVYNLLYMTSSGMNKAQGDTYAHLPVIGMCIETGTGYRKVLLRGLIKNTSWNFTIGARLYCSATTAGLLTATAPTTAGTQVQIVAIAIASDTILFNPDITVVEN